MQEKITKKAIDALRAKAKADGKTILLWDAELTGFGAIATKGGACSYIIQYRLGGRGTPSKRLTIGKHGVLTPEEGRKLAKEKLGEVATGTDVAQEKKDRISKLTASTFRDLSERYHLTHGKQQKTGKWKSRHWRDTHAQIVNLAYPVLAVRPLVSITRAQISALVEETKASSHSAARNLFGSLRPFFLWAVEMGAIEVSPMAGLSGPKPVASRDRVLTDDEIKALWQSSSDLGWPFENVFKLLLLTGQRREEVAGMRWREIDLDAGTWTIAKERCKNGKAHALDLCAEAIRLLDPIGEVASARLSKSTDDLVFSNTGTTPVSGFSKIKARIDTRMKEILGDRFEDWRTHDLRRTAASGMASLGFQPHIIERVLNHVSGAQGGLVGVYQRFDYREDRKRALLAWGDRVAIIVGEKKAASNVVPMRAA